MDNTLIMHSMICLDEDSPMTFRVCDDREVLVFLAGGPKTEFRVSFETEALRRFVGLASTALNDADALRTQAAETTTRGADGTGNPQESTAPTGSR